MKPGLRASILGAALVLTVSAQATARPQRHAPAGGGSQPAAVPRSAPAPAPAPAASAPSPSSGAGRESGRGQERAPSASRGGDTSNDNGSTAAGRRRGSLPKTGEATARTSPPRPPDGDHGGHGNGGVIAGGYPWWSSGYYGGYYAYDPGFGWYPTYDTTSADSGDDGALRLKVKPVEASVYVDGYYVGVVDEFDGVFQRLRLEPGPHHLEIRLPEYDDLSFDVMIQPDHTTTYRGDLIKRP